MTTALNATMSSPPPHSAPPHLHQSAPDPSTDHQSALALHPAYHDYADKDVLWVRQQVATSRDELEPRLSGVERELFPCRLYAALEACSASPTLFAVMHWLPHGRAFKIYDKQRFIREALPQHFHGQRVYGSFQRQLNMYGLLNLTGEHKDHGAYYHPLLLRGRPLLCQLLVRRYETESAVRRRFDPRSEPDFHQMPPLPDSMPLSLSMHNNTMQSGYHRLSTETATINQTAQRPPLFAVLYPTEIAAELGSKRVYSQTFHADSLCWQDTRGPDADSCIVAAGDARAQEASSQGRSDRCNDRKEHVDHDSTFRKRFCPQQSAFTRQLTLLDMPVKSQAAALGFAGFNSGGIATSLSSIYPFPKVCDSTPHIFSNVQVRQDEQVGEVKRRTIEHTLEQSSVAVHITGYGLVQDECHKQTIHVHEHQTSDALPSLEGQPQNIRCTSATLTTFGATDWVEQLQRGTPCCDGNVPAVLNIGILMSVEDAMAACDRDVYETLFSCDEH